MDFKKTISVVALGVTGSLLMACGGGGDSGPGTAAPPPSSPPPSPPPPPPAATQLPAALNESTPNASLLFNARGDGTLDLVVDGPAGNTRDWLLVNDGSGRFSFGENALPERYLGADGVSVAFAAIDANLDGREDLLVVTVDGRPDSFYGSSKVQLFLNEGDGRFVDASDNIAGGVNPNAWYESIRVADFDGDGYPDFLLTSSGNPVQSCDTLGGRIFLNDGTGRFTQARLTLTDALGSYETDCLRFDAGANTAAERHLGDDNLAFTLDALLGDLDGDGRPDILASSLRATWPVFLNRSVSGELRFELVFNGGTEVEGTCFFGFPPVQEPCTRLEPFDAGVAGFWKNGVLADIGGNGTLDLVVSTSIAPGQTSLQPVVLWRGEGDGVFSFVGGVGADDCALDESTRCGSFSIAEHPERVGVQHARQWLVLDINGNERDDVFVADHGWDAAPFPGRRNLLLLGQADGTLVDGSAQWLSSASTFTHGATVGDVTGNGRADLFKNNYYFAPSNGGGAFSSDNESKLWLNDGNPPLSGTD
jgi:hypothetical protein